MGYFIKRKRVTFEGRKTETLATDGLWYLEVSAKDSEHESLMDALQFWRAQKQDCKDCYIEGPKGGTYDLVERKQRHGIF